MKQPRKAPDARVRPSSFGHPYYIVAPVYTRKSAGVKALHLLCDALNYRGEKAYLIVDPPVQRIWKHRLPWRKEKYFISGPGLDTPELAEAELQAHFESGLAPITVYPEIVSGNPFGAPLVVRYVLNFPGLLGGARKYDPGDICFGYSRKLAEASGQPENVLFLPASDPRIFYPPAEGTPRAGTCFYARRYQVVHKAKLLSVTRESVEITSDGPDSPTANEIAELFRRSTAFYCYENTALATEAALCGCPTVILPNEHLTEIVGVEDFSFYGFAWGDSPEAVERARRDVEGFHDRYRLVIAQFWRQLDRFIEITQRTATGRIYARKISAPTVAASALERMVQRLGSYAFPSGENSPSFLRSETPRDH